jgi:hypothetical protein
MRFTVEEFHGAKLINKFDIEELAEGQQLTIGRALKKPANESEADCLIGASFPPIVAQSISRTQATMYREGDTFLVNGAIGKLSRTGVFIGNWDKDKDPLTEHFIVRPGDMFTLFQYGTKYSVMLFCSDTSLATCGIEMVEALQQTAHTSVHIADVLAELSDRVEALEVNGGAATEERSAIMTALDENRLVNDRQNQLIKFLLVCVLMLFAWYTVKPEHRKQAFSDLQEFGQIAAQWIAIAGGAGGVVMLTSPKAKDKK